MRFEKFAVALPSPVGNGQGAPLSVSEYIDKWVQIGGTFTATVAIQGTIDGTNWFELASSAIPTIVEIPQTVQSIRSSISGFVANTSLSVMLACRDARTD